MALAGLIHEQTKQQINGIPGLLQLPILGQLFKSRDYINRQSELVIIVTPYIVRAVAQKDLSRPDDGFTEVRGPGRGAAVELQQDLRRTGSREAARDLSRQVRLHSGLRA